MKKSFYLVIALPLSFTIILKAQTGSLDSTFSEDGMVTWDIDNSSNDIPYSGALQPDGKILQVGVSGSGVNADFIIVRYNTDGTPDFDFGIDGVVHADYNGVADRAHGVVIQPDGKIVVAGESNINGQSDFSMLRLHTDGSIDSTFGSNGWTTTDLGTSFEYPNAVVLQPDGKIVATGRMASGNFSDFAMVRYHADGQLDTLFGEHGIVTTDIKDEDEAYAIAIDSSERIVLAGYASITASGDFAVARYNPDGTPDKLFGDGGKVTTDLEGTNRSDLAKALLILPDGKILVAGNANFFNLDLTSDLGMVRYKEDGTLDTLFGINGIYIVALGTTTDVGAMAMQSDGKILIGAHSDVLLQTNQWLLGRFLPDGGLDTDFANSGITTANMPGSRESVNSMFIQPDGKVILLGLSGGSPNYDFAAARFINDVVSHVNEISFQNGILFDINPNPSDGTIHLKFNSTVTSAINIRVYDATGRNIHSTSMEGASSTEKFLDLTSLSKGSYFLFVSSDEKWGIRKFVLAN